MVPIILQSSQRINSLLIVYQEVSIYKFVIEWNQFKKLCRYLTNGERIYFDSKLDKLFDIIKCKRQIQKCSNFGYDGCEFEAHGEKL